MGEGSGVGRVERLTDVVALLLHATRPVSLDEIIRDLPGYPDDHESARVQFERDKRTLRSEGIEIRTVGEGDDAGYLIDPDDYYLPDLGLTDEETVALNVALSAVQIDGADPTMAGWKLGAAAPEASPLVALTSLPQLPLLQDAVARRRMLRFRYGGVDREAEPLGLLTRDGFWYLPAHDRTRGERRNFRVDRIDGDVTAGDPDSFDVPGDFDVRTALPDEPWELGAGEVTEATVHIDGRHAARVEAALGTARVVARAPDGSATITLTVRNAAGFRSWLFGLLDGVRVLGPPALVDDVVAHLRGMATEEEA